MEGAPTKLVSQRDSPLPIIDTFGEAAIQSRTTLN
jgi:hypothetical protein